MFKDGSNLINEEGTMTLSRKVATELAFLSRSMFKEISEIAQVISTVTLRNWALGGFCH